MKGFTLLETLVATAMLLVIMGSGVPVVADYYLAFRITSSRNDLINTLRKAQGLAMSNQFEDEFGVYVDTDKLVLFRGPSYASRTVAFDDEIEYSGALDIMGISEIVFDQLSGRPSPTGTITIADNYNSFDMDINEEGRFKW